MHAVEMDLAMERIEELRRHGARRRIPASPVRRASSPALPRLAAFRVGTLLVGWGERLLVYGETPKLSSLP